MKYFNHRELDAIAVCKHCGKAVCSQCVVETKGGIACRGACELVVALNDQRSHEIFGSSKVGYYAMAVFLAFAGLGFLVFSFPGGRYERMLTPFLCSFAAVFLGCAFYLYRIAKRMDQVR